ncbi:MAG TPA: hypothetical protein VKI17_05655 [Gemmataceae bacterium]|nr:hypothetical protein [Gemmataceae bacterium]
MESLRLAPSQTRPRILACCRCHNDRRHWDRVAGRAYCPECQEQLVLGVASPLTERTEKKQCAACGRTGTVCFLTFPLQSTTPVEMDLCPEHLRALLGRRLGPYAFHQIRRRLHLLGLGVELIFLLHEAFYDEQGRALQPALECD